MTIINKITDYPLFVTGDVDLTKMRCSVCATPLVPPFVVWDGAQPAALRLCKFCCHAIRRGLTLDMLQVAAALELQEACGSTKVTLERSRIDQNFRAQFPCVGIILSRQEHEQLRAKHAVHFVENEKDAREAVSTMEHDLAWEKHDAANKPEEGSNGSDRS